MRWLLGSAEAWYYAGSKRLILGDKAAAATYFEKCVAVDAPRLVEAASAAAELGLLKAEP